MRQLPLPRPRQPDRHARAHLCPGEGAGVDEMLFELLRRLIQSACSASATLRQQLTRIDSSVAASAWAAHVLVVGDLLRAARPLGLVPGVPEASQLASLGGAIDAILADALHIAAADAPLAAAAAALQLLEAAAMVDSALLFARLDALWPLMAWAAAASAFVASDSVDAGHEIREAAPDASSVLSAMCAAVVTAHADKRALPDLIQAVASSLCRLAAAEAGSAAHARHMRAAGAFDVWAADDGRRCVMDAVAAAPAPQAAVLVTNTGVAVVHIATKLTGGADAALGRAGAGFLTAFLSAVPVVPEYSASLLAEADAVARSVGEQLVREASGRDAGASSGDGAALAFLCQVHHAALALTARCWLLQPPHESAPAQWRQLQGALATANRLGQQPGCSTGPCLRASVAALVLQRAELLQLLGIDLEDGVRALGLQQVAALVDEACAPLVAEPVAADFFSASWDGVVWHLDEATLPLALWHAVVEAWPGWCAAPPPPKAPTTSQGWSPLFALHAALRRSRVC